MCTHFFSFSTASSLSSREHKRERERLHGSKKALIVGLNYPGSNMDLKGCVHDAWRFKKCIIKYFGFKAEDIEFLVDEQIDLSKPDGLDRKKRNNISVSDAVILDALFDLVQGYVTMFLI
jgi:hypothetical protein